VTLHCNRALTERDLKGIGLNGGGGGVQISYSHVEMGGFVVNISNPTLGFFYIYPIPLLATLRAHSKTWSFLLHVVLSWYDDDDDDGDGDSDGDGDGDDDSIVDGMATRLERNR